ncbi:MAG: alpha/beta hydrolase [Pseudomonadota bacterium]
MKRLTKIVLWIFLILAAATGFVAYKYPAAIMALLVSSKGYYNQENHVYGQLPRQRYDLYIPHDVKTDAPLLVFFYGGGWSMGDKALYRFVGRAFASRDIIVAIPNYRVYPDVIFPTFMQDAAAAVSKIESEVRAKYGNRHKLFLSGHSAGAHIAALLALDKSYLKAQNFDAPKITGVIGLSGPYDFLPLTEDKYKKIFPENVRNASQPINFVSGKMPPMLLITGTSDTVVKPANTEHLVAKINASGGKAQIVLYEGVGHYGTVLSLYDRWLSSNMDVQQDIMSFIEVQAK